jgi:hypothetical protein
MKTIQPKELKALIGNQEKLKNLNSGTTRATFKLSYLKELIGEIEKQPGFVKDDDFTHNICITFVREDLQALKLYTLDTNKQLDKGGHYDTASGKKYSQVIPVITGCEFKYDQGFNPISFQYLRNSAGEIPNLRPGGEGSGLIPPPPAGSDDGLT